MLSTSDWERVIWSGGPTLAHPVAVDIVTRQALRGYGRLLLAQLGEAHEFLYHLIGVMSGAEHPE